MSADVVGLFFLSVTAAYVLLHVSSLAASLAGGLSLGNPGGDATRGAWMLWQGATSGLSRFTTAWALGSAGGSLSRPRTGAVHAVMQALPSFIGQPGSDLYQRASFERLRRGVSGKG